MKKLLTMLGPMTLIGTVSTSVIACDGGKTPTPPDTRIDISNKIKSLINLGQLSANAATEFLAKLQDKLKTMSDLSITTNDYIVYKAGTTTVKQNSDVANNSLNIKIVAKSNNFEGEKDNTQHVIYTQHIITNTDISTKITKLTILNSIIVDINNNIKN